MNLKRTFVALLVLALWAGGALAQAPVVDPGWETFVIRNSSSGDVSPVIQYNAGPPDNSIEFQVPLGGQKAGLATNLINGATISQIATLHVDRVDPYVVDYPYGPYFNIWVTDGLGNYAVIANEPSNGEWGGDPWDVAGWGDLSTKTCKVYETPGWNSNSSWVHTHVGHSDPLTFGDVADLVIAPPPVSYITNPANGVGSGAPDELGTNTAYGYTWVFGDTASNYVGGYVVNGYSATATLGVQNVTQGTQYGTIEAALAAAVDFDVITVANDTYNPVGSLVFNKPLTMTGESEAGVIINVPAAGGYPMSVTASNVTLENFTIACVAANENFPIHASGTGNPPNGLDYLTIRNATISGAHRRTGFDIHGYNYVVLSNLTSTDAWGGNGLQVTGCVDVDMDNITCTGNAWGSIAIYCSKPEYLDRGSDDVEIDGTTLVADGAIFSQDEFGHFNTNVVLPGWEYEVTNNHFREGLGYTDSEGYTFFAPDQPTALALALGFTGYEHNSALRNTTLDVLEVYPGMAIQGAIDAADPADTINISAGNFEEQLHVTKDDLKLVGSGTMATFIEAPESMPLTFMTSSVKAPVVYVNGATGVDFSFLTLDGLGRGNSNNGFLGFGYYNAGGSLSDVHVANVVNTPFSGAQYGVGVYCYGDAGDPYTFNMTDVLVDGFQKTAVAISGAGVTSALLRVQTVGAGPTDITAQNGIQAGYEAVVNATDCQISGIAYTGGSWSASGVLSVADGVANFTGCTIDGCQTSAYFSDGGGSFNTSSVTNPLGDALYAYSGGAKSRGADSPLPAQPFDDPGKGSANKAEVTVSINGSTFTGVDAVDSWGPTAYGYGPLNFTITNSTVSHWDYGVVLYDFGGAVFNASGSGNNLVDNVSYGAFSNALQRSDFRNNNWGDASGPLHPGHNPTGLGNSVSDMIDFTPWTGRTVTVVADLGIGPVIPAMADVGYGFWEGTAGIGRDDEFVPGFEPGSIQAANAYVKYGFTPAAVFGRSVNVGELYSITYHTQKGTDHVVDAGDWFFQMYTEPYDGSPGSGWYGNRINSEPYFSENLTETPGEWTPLGHR